MSTEAPASWMAGGVREAEHGGVGQRRAGRERRRRCAGGGGRARCTTATRRRRCSGARRCRSSRSPRPARRSRALPRAHARCWVNGCQRCSRSSAASSQRAQLVRPPRPTLAMVQVGMPPSAPARLRGRHRLPRRGDRGGPAAGALLWCLDDRVGEHDRRRARGAVGGLLARRPLGRPPPDCRGSACSRSPPPSCWRSCLSLPTRCSTRGRRARRDLGERLPRLARWGARPCRCAGAAAGRGLTVGAPPGRSQAWRRPATWRAGSMRCRRRAACWARCSPRSSRFRWWARGARFSSSRWRSLWWP